MKPKEDIQYYVEVGSNGIGYSTHCRNLTEAKECYMQRIINHNEVKLIKYNFTRDTETILKHYGKKANN